MDVARLAPSTRSLTVAFALLATAAGAYLAAWHTPLFAIRSVQVVGASGTTAERVHAALRGLEGQSLASLRPGEVERRVAALPDVVRARYDRAFPHTLIVFVRAERPVAVLRRGAEAWLVSARGRAIARLRPGARLELPRIWVTQAVAVGLGEFVTESETARAIRVLAQPALRRLPSSALTVRIEDGEAVLTLRSGLEVRLGGESSLPLKLAVARAIVPRLEAPPPGRTAYLDLRVLARPVAGTESKAQP